MKNPYLKSGKVGNVVYSRNRHGQICYVRFIPANPRTARQMAVRNLWAVISALWRQLNDEQREQWRAAGREQRSRRRMGRNAPLLGFHYFMRVNMRRAYRGEEWVELPPSTSGQARSRGSAAPQAEGKVCQRPTYGVPAAYLRCTNGILSHVLRCWQGVGTVFRAAGGASVEPFYPAMN